MASVSGVGWAGAGAPGGPKRVGGGFSVAAGTAATAAGAAAPTAAADPVSMGAMLALQEMPGEPVRDRAARKHGEAMLRLLAALQKARLGGAGAPAALAELGRLVAGVPEAADPGLRRLVSAVALRARIELARMS